MYYIIHVSDVHLQLNSSSMRTFLSKLKSIWIYSKHRHPVLSMSSLAHDQIIDLDSLPNRISMTPTQSILTKPSRSLSRNSLTRNMSVGSMMAPPSRTEAKVLVIYTGGTIGMMRNDKGGKLRNKYYYIHISIIFAY